MKIFISQPMRGLDDETIKARRQAAIDTLTKNPAAIVVDSFFEGEAMPDNPLQLLGRSISMLQDVDAIYMLEGWENANGCCIEHECARRYGKTIIYEKPGNVDNPPIMLADTIQYMLSKDFKKRTIAEYKQLKIRLHNLINMIDQYEAGTLDFKPNCDIDILKHQATAMDEYLKILKKRARIEDIDLNDNMGYAG